MIQVIIMAVFAMVTAWVAPGLIDVLPGKKEEFFQKLQKDTGIEYTCTANNTCLIQGQWECIKQAYYALEHIDNDSSENSAEGTDSKSSKQPQTVESFSSGNISIPKSSENVSFSSPRQKRCNVVDLNNLAQESVRRWQTKCQKDKADAENLSYFIYSAPQKDLVDGISTDSLPEKEKDKEDELLKSCTIFKVPGVTFHGLTKNRNDIEVVKEPVNSSSDSTHKLKTLAGEIEADELILRNSSDPGIETENAGSDVEVAPPKKRVNEGNCKSVNGAADNVGQKETLLEETNAENTAGESHKKVNSKRKFHLKKAALLNRRTSHLTNNSSPEKEDEADQYDKLVEMTAKPAYKTRRFQRVTRAASQRALKNKKTLKSVESSKPSADEEQDSAGELSDDSRKGSECAICGYVTADKRNLVQHLHRAHCERKFKCETCGRRYALEKDLQIHKITHNKRFVCNTCGRVYKQESVLRKHMLTHSDDFVKPVFKCDECERTFSTRYTLTNHMTAVHRGEATSFLCPTCGKSFTQKHTLVEHQNVHLGVKPFSCEVCKMCFTFSSSLRQHRMKHDSVKRYKCVECGKDFTHRNSLRLHKVIHLKERPFKCQFCSRSFTQKQALQRHERIHRGEKPFICEICGRSFTDNSTLRRHINTHSKSSSSGTLRSEGSTVKITNNRIVSMDSTDSSHQQPIIGRLSPLPLASSTEHHHSPISGRHSSMPSPIVSSRQQGALTILPPVTSSIDIHHMQLATPHQHSIHQQQQHLHLQHHHLQQSSQQQQAPLSHHSSIHQQMLHPGQQYGIPAPPMSNPVYAGIYDDSVMIPMSMMTTEDAVPMHY